MGSIGGGCPSTGLANNATTYTATITVDGTPIVVSIQGQNAQSYCDLVSQITIQLVSPAAFASLEDNEIVIRSNTIGAGSSISIVDGGTPLFGSLSGYVGLGATFAGIDYTYREVGTYNFASTSIQFITAIPSGVVLEFTVIGEKGLPQ